MFKRVTSTILLLLLMLSFSSISTAQTDTDAALETVIAAYDELRAVEGYTFSTVTLNDFSLNIDTFQQTTVILTTAVGAVDIQGDRQIEFTRQSGEKETEYQIPPLKLSTIYADGQHYLNIRSVPPAYEELFDPIPQPGWNEYESLRIVQLGKNMSTLGTVTLDELIDFFNPLAQPLNPESILTLDVLPPETLDGIETSVYALQIDALPYFISEGAFSLNGLAEDGDVRNASQLDVMMSVWIRTDTEQIMQLQVITNMNTQYLSDGSQNAGPSYDVNIEERATTRFLSFGDITDITAPTASTP